MLVYSNIHTQSTEQVNGAAKIMVTVVAIQELEAGDVLRRFKAEAAQDEPGPGNNNNRCTVVRLIVVAVCTLSLHMIFFSLVCCVFLLFVVGTRVCVLLFSLVRACVSSCWYTCV